MHEYIISRGYSLLNATVDCNRTKDGSVIMMVLSMDVDVILGRVVVSSGTVPVLIGLFTSCAMDKTTVYSYRNLLHFIFITQNRDNQVVQSSNSKATINPNIGTINHTAGVLYPVSI